MLDDVAAGDEVEITKDGRTVARLIPAQGAHSLLKRRFAGIAMSPADDDLFSTGVRWRPA